MEAPVGGSLVHEGPAGADHRLRLRPVVSGRDADPPNGGNGSGRDLVSDVVGRVTIPSFSFSYSSFA